MLQIADIIQFGQILIYQNLHCDAAFCIHYKIIDARSVFHGFDCLS